MCNIAGYVGERNAAPILLEMIKAQETFDGGRSTGIATIHDGKIYMRKVVGNADKLISDTDALSLPGKIGIIHSRPGGDHVEFAHPFMADGERLCMVMNGTTRYGEHLYNRKLDAVEMLNSEGYKLSSRKNVGETPYTVLHTGEAVTTADGGANYTEYLIRKGKTPGEAISEMTSMFYADIVSVMLSLYDAEGIYVCRVTRPMCALIRENESFISTTAFGFPEELQNEEIKTIPAMKSYRIGKNTIDELPYSVDGDEVAAVTDEVYNEAYKRVEKLLSDKWCIYDDVENFIYYDCDDLWDKKYKAVEHAPLTYKILFNIYKSGKLKREIRPEKNRERTYMHVI